MRQMMSSRENRCYAVLLGVMILSLLAAGWHHRQAGRQLLRLTEEHRKVQAIVQHIEQLRDRPAMAGADELELAELSRLIEQAAHDAQIPLDRLVRIWPEQPQRVRDTAYLEKPTQVLFRGVTLKQSTTFLHGLSHAGTGLRIKSMRITAPRDEADGEAWIVEATLTYLLYSPTTQES